jgi:hypothetical protein
MLRLGIQVVVAILASTSMAWPCEMVGPSLTPEKLVQAARIVVRAKAERVGDTPARSGLFALPTQVHFRVMAVYKGTWDSDVMEFNGVLGAPKPNERPTPYDFGRPRSFTPSCFNPAYVQGAEYLLLLGPDDGVYSEAGDLTPYWAGQHPTNERVLGDDDPWLLFVTRAVRLAVPNKPQQPTSGGRSPGDSKPK